MDGWKAACEHLAASGLEVPALPLVVVGSASATGREPLDAAYARPTARLSNRRTGQPPRQRPRPRVMASRSAADGAEPPEPALGARQDRVEALERDGLARRVARVGPGHVELRCDVTSQPGLARPVEPRSRQQAVREVHEDGLVLLAARAEPLLGRVSEPRDPRHRLDLRHGRLERCPAWPDQGCGCQRRTRWSSPAWNRVGRALEENVQASEVDLVADRVELAAPMRHRASGRAAHPSPRWSARRRRPARVRPAARRALASRLETGSAPQSGRRSGRSPRSWSRQG